MRLTTSSRRARTRAGINLVELLVVIAIISVLVALLGVALSKTTERQRNRSTNDQLYKLQQSIDQEYDKVVKQCDKDAQTGQMPSGLVGYADNNPERARAIWTALKLRQHFPESFAEAVVPLTLIDQTSGAVLFSLESLEVFKQFRSTATGPGGTPLPNIQAASVTEERAALLYVILAKKSASGGGAMAAAADDLGLQRKVNYTGINGGANRELQTFADSWGGSVGFYRAYGLDPAHLPEIQAPPYTTATGANKDPLDPRNLVFGWNTTPQKRGDMDFLGFRGRNRMMTVYSLGKSPTDATDDLWGHRHRQYR
jgi:type II secretory pathway pseudopilin PulG